MAFSSANRSAPENDHHADRDIDRNFSAVMAELGTVNITPARIGSISIVRAYIRYW